MDKVKPKLPSPDWTNARPQAKHASEVGGLRFNDPLVCLGIDLNYQFGQVTISVSSTLAIRKA